MRKDQFLKFEGLVRGPAECRLGSATGGTQISLFLTGVLQDLPAEGLNTFKRYI